MLFPFIGKSGIRIILRILFVDFAYMRLMSHDTDHIASRRRYRYTIHFTILCSVHFTCFCILYGFQSDFELFLCPSLSLSLHRLSSSIQTQMHSLGKHCCLARRDWMNLHRARHGKRMAIAIICRCTCNGYCSTATAYRTDE